VVTTRYDEHCLQIRITTRPDPLEFGEFGVQHFRVGEVYDVSATLGSLLVIAGHAEPLIGAGNRVEADVIPIRPKNSKF
jgi:hypothetical protein